MNKEKNNVPSEYILLQNYPNPFNPTTNIKYQITNNSFVNLKVFDVLGKEVSTLVNQNLQPGEYEVTFNASKMTSGVYFYKLKANEFSEIKKMLFIK
ncbi:MAG: T9SS type A sorting domain-containing protein [Ignavibacteriae bacterium]|nr:T9SS type A sorting domain-containing protein [Ignavibacteriota bacterium]